MQRSRKYKPLPAQPLLAPDNLNQPLSDRDANKRAKRHAEREAEREPHKKLMVRDDLDVRGRQIYTLQWLKNMDSVMRLWCEFLRTKLDRFDGPDYFKSRGPVPDQLLLHQFLFWVGDTSVGNMYTASHEPSTMTKTDKVTTGTVERYAVVLASALGYYNRRLDPDLVKSTRLWVRNNLASEIDLNREVKEKPVAYTADVENLIEAIWNYNSIAVFKNIRAMLNTTLVLNLLIDGASRIGEFVPTSADSKKKGRYLKWRDLEFYIHPTDDAVGITIHIIVLCKWLKFGSYDPQATKSFVIRLLPPHLAFQDSCRLLVVLALHQGYFRDFRTWDELLSCRPNQTGQPILLQPSCLNLPVFAPLAHQSFQIGASDLFVDTDADGELLPWTYLELNRIVQKLSRLAGFARKTGLHQLRHGDAYLLSKHCKDRVTARTLMGQLTESAFKVYISKTSTTDVQSLARDVPTHDLTPFSGLTLGTCSNAPLVLPPEELAKIDQHPEFLEAMRESSEAKIDCIRQFGSLAETRQAAKQSAAAAQLLREYERSSQRKAMKWKRLAELRFRAFREEMVRELTAAKPADKIDVDMETTGVSPESEAPITENYWALEGEPEVDGGPTEESPNFLHDRVEDIGHLTVEQAASMIAAVPGTTLSEDASDSIATVVKQALDQQVRQHGLFRASLNVMVGGIGRRTTNMSSFSPHYARLGEKYRAVAKDEGVTSNTVMALFMDLLLTESHMRDLPNHWISANDASKCVVCQETLTIDTGYTHVYKCLQLQAKAHADKLWDAYLEGLPTKCTWTPSVKSRACKVDLTMISSSERQKHFHKHNNSSGYKCYWHGCQVVFASQEDLCQHVYAEHRILLWNSSICLYSWCQFCQKNIFEVKYMPERLAHFAAHYAEAFEAVRDYGYTGVTIGSSHAGHRPKQFVTAFCIFCLHDEKLNAEDRLLSPRVNELAPHMHSHFRYLSPDDKICCPASSAGGAREPLCLLEQSMTPAEAWMHIQEIHYGIEFGPKWGPGGEGKTRGKRVIEQVETGEEAFVQRTKVYEKKKPVTVKSDPVPDEETKNPTASILKSVKSVKSTIPLVAKDPNTHGRLQHQIDNDLSFIDPTLR